MRLMHLHTICRNCLLREAVPAVIFSSPQTQQGIFAHNILDILTKHTCDGKNFVLVCYNTQTRDVRLCDPRERCVGALLLLSYEQPSTFCRCYPKPAFAIRDPGPAARRGVTSGLQYRANNSPLAVLACVASKFHVDCRLHLLNILGSCLILHRFNYNF